MSNPLDFLDTPNPLMDVKKEKKEVVLTEEQKLLILKEWGKKSDQPPGIPELIQLCFPELSDDQFDARTVYGRAVREYLILKFGPETVEILKPTKKEIILSPEQEEYIRNNCSNMRPFEMGKELFQNPRLSPVSTEMRLIKEFLKTLPNAMIGEEDEEGLEFEYKPPKRLEHVLARIIKYVKDCKIDKNKLTPAHRKQAEALIGYLHDFRLCHQINTYENTEDKKLFESSFISYTWDKSDLSAEDVHQYIILCTEVVMSASIQRTINMLQIEQDRALECDGKVNMALVELIGNTRNDYNSSVKRQETLFKALVQERSKRLNERVGPQFTLLNIVEEMKNEERRKALILEAEKRNDKIKGEIARLSAFDEMICRIHGVDEDLIING